MARAPSLGVAGAKAALGSSARPSRPTRLRALALRRRDTRPAGMPEGIPGARRQSERDEQAPDDHSRARGRALPPRRAWPNRESGRSRGLGYGGGAPSCRCVSHQRVITPLGGRYLPGRRAVCRLGRAAPTRRAEPAAQGARRQRVRAIGETGSRFEPERTGCSPSRARNRGRPADSFALHPDVDCDLVVSTEGDGPCPLCPPRRPSGPNPQRRLCDRQDWPHRAISA